MKKKNDKTFKQFLTNHAVKIWIALVVLSLTGFVVYAAYPNKQNVVKRVIATSADKNMRFSSNYLEEGNTKFKTIVNPGNPAISVYVRNYTKNNDGLRYANDIVYQLTAVLTDTSGIRPGEAGYDARLAEVLGESETVTVSLTGGSSITLSRSSYSDSLNSTLAKGDARQDEFKVQFPSAESKVCIILTATPVGNYPDLAPISAILSVSSREPVQADGWEGSFNDSRAVGKTPATYDAYNYTLNGHGLCTNASFSWDSNKVDINRQYFTNHLGANFEYIIPLDEGWYKIMITVGGQSGDQQIVRYDFQIFKAGNTSFNNWEELEAAVEFDDGL